LGLYSGSDYVSGPVVLARLMPHQLVIRMGRVELQHTYQMGSDRILILVTVTDRNLRKVTGREFYTVSARVH